jgi:hypothetical protein
MKRPPEAQRPEPRDDARWRDFERRWRRWGERPPRTHPETAARRVLTRLAEPAPRPGWRPAGGWTSLGARRLAVAALVLAAVGVWLLTAGLPGPFTGPGPTVAPERAPGGPLPATPAMADGVVLMWLDAETPLYMTFAPPSRTTGAEKGDGS